MEDSFQFRQMQKLKATFEKEEEPEPDLEEILEELLEEETREVSIARAEAALHAIADLLARYPDLRESYEALPVPQEAEGPPPAAEAQEEAPSEESPAAP